MKNMFKIISNDSKAHRWQAPCFESANESNILHGDKDERFVTESKQETNKRAYEAAFEKGYKDGIKQGQIETNEKVSRLVSLMNTLARPLEKLDESVVNELVELSMTVVKHMVRRELKTSPDEIVVVVKEALNLLPVASSNIHLELHPEDASLVREALGNSEKEQPWKIIEDPVLSRGGCRIVTENSRIDATVENRLNAAIASVMGGERQEDTES